MIPSTNKLSTYSEDTHLLSLPNELLEIIFEFLASAGLIQSIFLLNYPRLNALIYPLISRVDLIKFPNEYLKTIFTLISSVRIDSNQINEIRLAPSLRSLVIVQTNPADRGFLSFLPHLARHLNSLSLHLHTKCNIDKLLLSALIFQSNCSLESLTILSDRAQMFIELGHIVPCSTLKRITLSLTICRHLFILCEHLLSLEYLEILSCNYDENDRLFNNDEYVLQKPVSKHLHELRIDTHGGFARIELFVQQFASSVQYLTLRLGTWKEPVDGHRLEKGLINVCTKLKKFKFYFTFSGMQDTSVDYESFEPVNGSYWSSHPVVCFDHTVASLPLTGWYFRSFGNAFPNEIYFNVSHPPPFKRVRQIELTELDGPLSLALFKFVERFFTHADRLYISSECRLADFDWTLLPRFPRVKTLTMYMYYRNEFDVSSPPDAALLRAFFSLVPNLRRWQTSTEFLKEYEALLRTDQQLREVFERIEEVQMSIHDNKQMEEFVHSLFPNARVRFDFSVHNMYL